MIRAEYNTLEMCPKALNAIGVDVLRTNVFTLTVVHEYVIVAILLQLVIDGCLVGVGGRATFNELAHNGHQGCALSVFHLHCNHLSITLNHAEDWGLGLCGTTLSALSALAFVLVGLTTTKVHLIHFNLTTKGYGIALTIETTNLMQHKPRSLLRDLDVTTKLVAANTLLVAAHKVHCHKPLAK